MIIKKLFLTIFLFFFTITYAFHKPFTIMINPAGDAKDAGRTLHDCFERGVTLKFVQELKKNLEINYPYLRVVLTRIPGETLDPLQNANFSNRLNADFYLSIHFYKEKEIIPKVYLYYYLSEPFYVKSSINLFFYNFDSAHLINIPKTIEYSEIFKNSFNNNQYKNKFDFKGVYAIPFKPLVGIKAPSLALEIGLKNTNEFSIYIETISHALGQIIQ